jgi:hypothetical protein
MANPLGQNSQLQAPELLELLSMPVSTALLLLLLLFVVEIALSFFFFY